MSVIKKIMNRLQMEYGLRYRKDPFLIAARNWFSDKGDETLRLDYPLNHESVVIDVGGYKGEWAGKIYNKYSSNIYIFEPVSMYYENITDKFVNNGKVHPFQFGLSCSDKEIQMAIQDDGSSTVRLDSKEKSIVHLKDVLDVFNTNNFGEIALIKINIEGGEFDLLERMLETGLVDKCNDLQIQFHDFFPDAKDRRQRIREKLRKTHRLTFDYYFVWENWVRL